MTRAHAALLESTGHARGDSFFAVNDLYHPGPCHLVLALRAGQLELRRPTGSIALAASLAHDDAVLCGYTPGHHRRHSVEVGVPSAPPRHHFSVVLRSRPPVALWTHSAAALDDIARMLRAAAGGSRPLPPAPVLRIGVLYEVAESLIASPAPRVALLLRGRLILFTGADGRPATPSRVLEPLCAAEAPRRQHALDIEISYAQCVCRLRAPDAAGKAQWLAALQAACGDDAEASGARTLSSATVALTKGATRHNGSSGSTVASAAMEAAAVMAAKSVVAEHNALLEGALRMEQQSSHAAGRSLASAGINGRVARVPEDVHETVGLRALESARTRALCALRGFSISTELLRGETRSCEEVCGVVELELAQQLAQFAQCHARGGGDGSFGGASLMESAGERLRAVVGGAGSVTKRSRVSEALAEERQQHRALLLECEERELKWAQLAETVARLPAEMVNFRRTKGDLSPLEAALRLGGAFFSARAVGPMGKGGERVLSLDVSRRTLTQHDGASGRTVAVHRFDSLLSLLPGYCPAHFRSAADRTLGILCGASGEPPIVLELESKGARDEMLDSLRSAVRGEPYEPAPILHSGRLLFRGRDEWAVLIPSQLLLLGAADETVPKRVLSLRGAVLRLAPTLSHKMVLDGANGSSDVLEARQASELSSWIGVLSRVLPTATLQASGSSRYRALVEQPPLSPENFERLSGDLSEAEIHLGLMQEALADAEKAVRASIASAQERLAAAAAQFGACAGSDFGRGGLGLLGERPPTEGANVDQDDSARSLQLAKLLNSAVRDELRSRDVELLRLQEAMLLVSTVDWEWASPVGDHSTLWQVWSQCQHARHVACHREGAAQDESSFQEEARPLPLTPPEASAPPPAPTHTAEMPYATAGWWSRRGFIASSIFSGVREMLSPSEEVGIPLGVVDRISAPTEIVAPNVPQRRRARPSEDWLISFANKILET